MRIAVIGTGNIGSTLARRWVGTGHDVVLGSRNPDAVEGAPAPVADFGTALTGADAVLLAIPSGAIDAFVQEYGAALGSAVVIDASNRMGAPVANARSVLMAARPDLHYVRAFNTLGWENFADPDFDGGPADLFFSSADADRGVAERLIADVGLRPAYLGADREDVVDKATLLWFALSQQRGTRRIAFRVLQKSR
jgi:predicted dinucleotide-binding enzyme